MVTKNPKKKKLTGHWAANNNNNQAQENKIQFNGNDAEATKINILMHFSAPTSHLSTSSKP